MKEKVRPIYSQLIGFLSQAPPPQKVWNIYDRPLWQQFHQAIQELNDTTRQSYDKFKISQIVSDGLGQYISNSEYRSKLNGLIMRLHAEYFKDEPAPFGGGPAMVLTQQQNQSLSAQITMITNFQTLIDKKLYGSKLEEKEKTFLEKIKAKLPAVSSVAELISSILSIAKDMNLNINQVAKILGL